MYRLTTLSRLFAWMTSSVTHARKFHQRSAPGCPPGSNENTLSTPQRQAEQHKKKTAEPSWVWNLMQISFEFLWISLYISALCTVRCSLCVSANFWSCGIPCLHSGYVSVCLLFPMIRKSAYDGRSNWYHANYQPASPSAQDQLPQWGTATLYFNMKASLNKVCYQKVIQWLWQYTDGIVFQEQDHSL